MADADNVPPPANLRVTSTGSSLVVNWDSAAGATGYQIAIDGSSPAPAQPGHVFTVRAGQSGIIQVRTVKGDKHSAWAQLSYQAADAPKPGEKPIQWVFTWANAGWKDGDMKTGVLREYFWAPGLKNPDGKVKSFEYPVSSKTGEPLEAPNNPKIQKQYIASPSNLFANDGSYAVISWTGEGAKIEASTNGGGDTWERSAISIEKRAVSTAPKADGSGREYINATAGYDIRWTNTDTRGYVNRDVKPGDKGIELKREGNVMVYSVIRADGSRERLVWFPYSDLRSSSGIEIHGGTWGEITGVFYDAS